jgi:TonB-dependent receptor
MKLKLLLIILITGITKVTFSQSTGIIKGKVIDEKTGETLPGALVMIKGTTTGVSTDFDGVFLLKNITAGTYILECKYISYNSKVITDVVVKSGEETTVNISLVSAATELGVVEITATMSKENNAGLIIQQKNNASVSDGISSEAIKKTPDRNTSDVLKRISGASIQDNKFAIIRGMNDRYNSAYINGAPLPSSESDRRAFAFDIFPSNLLDNIVILKTATPDLPGDFAGGVIQINTKGIPEKNEQMILVSGSYNTITTFKNFKTYDGGKYDWLGIDDGTRKLNKDIPPTLIYNNSTQTSNSERADYAKLMGGDWSLKNKAAAIPSLNLQYSLANTGKLFKREAGSVFALTYYNNYTTSFSTRREFEEQDTDVLKTKEYIDTSYTNNILSSAMWNVSYKLNSKNELSLKNMYSINTDNKVNVRGGLADVSGPQWEKSNVRWFTQNNIYSGQLGGDHVLSEKYKIKFKWQGALSNIKREIPNMRKMVYAKIAPTAEDTAFEYQASIQPNSVTTTSGGSMFFSVNKENIYSAKYELSIPFQLKKTKHEFKAGGFHQLRDRDFSARLFGFTQYRSGSQVKFNNTLLQLPEDKIFSIDNMGVTNTTGANKGGFKLTESTTPLDSYLAASKLHAGFLMLDSRLMEKFRLIYGARLESYRQTITNYDIITGDAITRDTTFVNILPSVNAVWSLTDKTNLRFAYYQTVSRPEFRELAKFNFYDFILDYTISGNPDLKQATINNYDLRYEWYPGAGQVFSTSVFYKEINNAIEQIAAGASQIRSISYANVDKVQNMGAELEYRFKLNTIFRNDSSSFLNNTTLFTNLAYIQSKIDQSDVVGATDRPMQGQSPYLVNAGLQYLNTEKGYSASISYNVYGKRIFIVGSDDEPSYWENPRNVVDLQLTKTLLKGMLDIKLNARDILAQPYIFYQDINNNGKYDKNSEKENNASLTRDKTTDNVMIRTTVGAAYSLSVALRF